MRTEFLCISVLRVASGPRVKLASCKSALTPAVVYSTDRSKAVVPVLVLLFVALWFILRGDLFYVLPCVILYLCFSVLLALRLLRLGKRELILVFFVRLFDLCLFRFVGFLFLLVSGLRFVIVALPGLFSYPFFISKSYAHLQTMTKHLGPVQVRNDRHKTGGVTVIRYILSEGANLHHTNHRKQNPMSPRFSSKRRGTMNQLVVPTSGLRLAIYYDTHIHT